MRQRDDNLINRTHILKGASRENPTRMRILKREVQKKRHETIKGGHVKYQSLEKHIGCKLRLIFIGTWVSLDQERSLAQRNQANKKIQKVVPRISNLLKFGTLENAKWGKIAPTSIRYTEENDRTRENPHENQILAKKAPVDSGMDLD
ncbi:putative ank-repeat protein mbp1 [Golovinomyces cichoracearum]|uniref:Putative ank-repeat protein mbp1 n=1 Tax=Golovinomyces cichoracearum TaxID=62708 RepID=A0A420J406_9PEZI|nr:putative ank-repeat protein mbp1 [Golovinomyces cichoracearum]